MPIALPPPIQPSNVAVEEIRGRATENVVIAFAGRRVHVLGADVVAREVLVDRVTSARTLSEAVYAIGSALYEAGHPAAQIRYALVEPDLYVLVIDRPLTDIDMPQTYARFFSGLKDEPVLSDRELEPARILASLYADRAGLSGTLALHPQPDGLDLGLDQQPGRGRRARLWASVGNPGDRFLGRYFGDYGGQYSSRSGDEFSLSGRNALSGLNQRDGGGSYRENSLGYSRVSPLGIFGLGARDLDYRQDQEFPGFASPLSLEGKLRQAEVSWLTIPVAGFDRRWSLRLKLDYNRKEVRADELEPLLQKQEYGSAEFGSDYTVALHIGEQRFQLGTGVSIRKGLGSDRGENPTVLADLGYTLVKPALSLSTSFGADLHATLALSGQLSSDRVPEQQQWVIGGSGNLEAFLPGVIVGDSGGLARFQLGFPGWEFGGWKLVPSVFSEYAQAHFDTPDASRQQSSAAAADIGAALVLNWRRYIDASLAYAEAVMDRGIAAAARDDADAGLLFRLSFSY